LLEAALSFLGLFLAVLLVVPQGPQVVAVNEKWIDDLAVPFGGVKLYRFVGPVHIVLLQLSPLSREASADQIIPSNCFLGLD
jgi:hypothetical protein